MKDYWNELSLRERWSKRERFNFIINHIEEKSGSGNSNKEPVTEEPVIEEPTVEVTSNITVSVKDDEGNGINGAIVEVIANNTTLFTGKTGSAGGCTIRDVPIGDYSIQTSAEGYILSIDDYTVINGENTFEVVLEEEADTPTN